MANQFANCQDELAACQSAEFGAACEATIGTQTVAAVIGTSAFSDLIAAGGIAQGGAQILAIKKSLLTDFADTNVYPNGEPPKGTPTTVRGVTMEVVDVDERDGVFYITTGDMTADDAT